MEYCGLDLGRRSSRYCIVDNARDVVQEGDVRTHKTHLRRVFSKREPMRIVVEATTACFWVADQLIELGHDVRVVDPNQTKAIGAALIKHDKLDARVLAQLCAAGLLAEVRIPTLEQRLGRMRLTARDVLVRSRTRIVTSRSADALPIDKRHSIDGRISHLSGLFYGHCQNGECI